MSTRGITEKRRRPKICPHPASQLLSFRFLANHSPRSSFQRYGLHPRSASYLGVPFIPAFCLVQRIKGTPLPGVLAFVQPISLCTSCRRQDSVRKKWLDPRSIWVAEECERKRSLLIIVHSLLSIVIVICIFIL